MFKRLAVFLVASLTVALSFAVEGEFILRNWAGSDSVGVTAQRGRGHYADKLSILSGDKMFYLRGTGYVSGAVMPTTINAELSIKTIEDWTATKRGAYWSIEATPVTTATKTEVMRIGDMVSGLVVCHENFINPIAVDTNTILSDISVSTGALGKLTTSYVAADFTAQPVAPRALSWNYASTAKSSTGTVTFVGKNANGDTVTEIDTLNGSVCNINNVTSNAFALLTSVTIAMTTHTSTTAELFFVGTSSAIGLANDIYYSTNTFKVNEAEANVSTGYTIDPTYDTYLPATVPNGTNDYEIWYRVSKSPL